MTYLAILCLIIGITFICIELFVPGFGFFGIAGGILTAISVILTIVYIPFGFFVVLAETAIIVSIGFFAIKYIRNHQLYGKLILDETLEYEKKEYCNLENLIGKEGKAKTALKPFGSVDFNGVSIDVYADGEFINTDEMVKVTKLYNNKLYVKKVV